MTNEEIITVLSGLGSEFDVHVCEDAWYSERAITRAFSGLPKDKSKWPPAVSVVRVELPKGVLELHPRNEKIEILCYCCFGGNFQHGLWELSELKAKVESMKDHYCPPWPG